MRFLLVLCLALPVYGYDFTLGLAGPVTATPGHSLYLQIEVKVTEGVRTEFMAYAVESPFAASLVGPNTHPSWGMRTYANSSVWLMLDIPATATGEHVVSLTASSAGVSKQASLTVTVQTPRPFSTPLSTVGTVSASLARWESQMLNYGTRFCDEAAINSAGTWDGSVWYYDGDRVYQQMAAYTGDAKWLECARYVRNVYRPYVANADGRVPGWRVFTHGLMTSGEADAKAAALLLAEQSAYAGRGGGIWPALSRETAYLVHASRHARLMGEPQPYEAQAVSFALGHLDQWFNPKARYAGPYFVQPFMAGLTMEALIEHYEETKDPRVPPAVKMALDALWERHWVAADDGFDYTTDDDKVAGAPDLNLLIAPAYAWYYAQTGEALYRERGEQIFDGGVEKAWLGGGKQFSQNYRWSFDYVRWAALGAAPRVQTRTGDTVTRGELNAIIKELRESSLSKAQLRALIQQILAEL